MGEYCVTRMQECIPLRDETTLEQGVALFVNPLSALCMIDRCKVLKAKCVIVTAAASQLGRMMAKLLVKEGMTPICTVRREEQIKVMQEHCPEARVVNTSADDYKQQMLALSKELNPTVCLECIGGNMVGEIMSFLGFGGVCISYGLLSEQPIGGINALFLLGRKQTLESFLLPYYMMALPPAKQIEFHLASETGCQSIFATHINKRFGLHELDEARKFYHENQTAGKIIFRPDMTN